ncbi:MAG: imidazole glycerol phosphate synthase subunit HisH [Candidatus Didemnitutus sp.]|nr:imidazole glycerol phosphate synthase subunit HisH [Candidatus Didemnitutus sp.]
MIAIIDYGMGNPSSIRNMLGRLGHRAEMARTPADATAADRIILPGVGAFDEGMSRLGELGWTDALRNEGSGAARPLLGICLGMQLLFGGSEEGRLPGLGLVAGQVIRFQFPATHVPTPKIPHMGWRSVRPLAAGTTLFAGLEEQARFYFVHSYHCQCENPDERAAEADYGFAFTCAVRRGSLHGVQFHPEKSHRYGMKLLDNFAKLTP